MAKIGVNVRIDVTKLDKSRFYKANSGAVYADITMFLDPENESQYGDHGFATQSTSKEEREQGIQAPIIGNGKVFYGADALKGGQGGYQNQQNQTYQQAAPQKINPQAPTDNLEGIPF